MSQICDHNDHNIPVLACPCGNGTPVVSGDDVDGDVSCDECGRDTPVCGGTRNAIHRWNVMVSDHNAGKKVFCRPLPWLESVQDLLETIEDAKAPRLTPLPPKLNAALQKSVLLIRKAMTEEIAEQ